MVGGYTWVSCQTPPWRRWRAPSPSCSAGGSRPALWQLTASHGVIYYSQMIKLQAREGMILPQSIYCRVEMKTGSVSALSAGAFTASLYVMVIGWKGGAPPTPTGLGWFFHHDGMYDRNRQSPLCVYSVVTTYYNLRQRAIWTLKIPLRFTQSNSKTQE